MFTSLSAACLYVREVGTGSVECLSPRMADELVDWLAERGYSGLIQDDGVTVDFGR